MHASSVRGDKVGLVVVVVRESSCQFCRAQTKSSFLSLSLPLIASMCLYLSVSVCALSKAELLCIAIAIALT